MPTQSILKCIGPAGSGVLDVHLAQKVYPWMASSGANGCGQIAVMFDGPNRNHWLTRIHFPTFPLYLSIQTYSKPMMACAHEAWLVSWILPQHLTSVMALESVCRGQIFWPAGPTPGKSGGGWFILQNLGSAFSCMTKTQLELVCFKGRAKISQFYLALIGTNGLEGLELVVYHPDQAICWEIPYTARVENNHY